MRLRKLRRMVAYRQLERVDPTVDALEDLGITGLELAPNGVRRVCNALNAVDDVFVQHPHLTAEIIEAVVNTVEPAVDPVEPAVNPVEPLTKVFQCLLESGRSVPLTSKTPVEGTTVASSGSNVFGNLRAEAVSCGGGVVRCRICNAGHQSRPRVAACVSAERPLG